MTLKTQGFDVATMTLGNVIHELVSSREYPMPHQHTNSVLTHQRGAGEHKTYTQQHTETLR